MAYSENKHSEIYFQYYSINKTAYRERVRWYEEHRNEVQWLDYSAKFEIDFDYLICLFELGRYGRFLEKIDPIIEQSISDNIYTVNGENVFNTLLQKKAASFYNLHMYDKAEKVLESLIKIDSSDEVNKIMYARCLRLKKHPYEEMIKSISILFLFLGISFKTAQIIVVENFYHQYLEEFEKLVIFFFAAGAAGLIGREIWLRIKYRRLLNALRNIP